MLGLGLRWVSGYRSTMGYVKCDHLIRGRISSDVCARLQSSPQPPHWSGEPHVALDSAAPAPLRAPHGVPERGHRLDSPATVRPNEM